jgi:hypothetical protein
MTDQHPPLIATTRSASWGHVGLLAIATVLLGMLLNACGGSAGANSNDSKGAATYRLGGELQGLPDNTRITLSNGFDSVELTVGTPETSCESPTTEQASSCFLMPPLPAGASFDIKVATAPAGWDCGVANGGGVMTNNGVSNVFVQCVRAKRLRLLAGFLPSGETINGGKGTARFKSPVGIAVASNSNTIYVADSADHVVRRIATDGLVSTVTGLVGIAGSTPDRLREPKGIAVDPVDSSVVYVVDAGNRRVLSLTVPSDPNATFPVAASVVWSDCNGTPPQPSSLRSIAAAVRPIAAGQTQPETRLFVPWTSTSIAEIDPTRMGLCTLHKLDELGSGESITALTSTPDGAQVKLLVAVRKDNRALLYTYMPSTPLIPMTVPDFLPAIESLVAVSQSVVYATHGTRAFASKLEINRDLNPPGVTQTAIGADKDSGESGLATINGSASQARFETPRGIALGDGGVLYVSDSTAGTVRKIDPVFCENVDDGGCVTTWAGMSTRTEIRDPGRRDGTGANAEFASIDQMALVGTGDSATLYVLEAPFWGLRQIKVHKGEVTTLALNLEKTDHCPAVIGRTWKYSGQVQGLRSDAHGKLYFAAVYYRDSGVEDQVDLCRSLWSLDTGKGLPLEGPEFVFGTVARNSSLPAFSVGPRVAAQAYDRETVSISVVECAVNRFGTCLATAAVASGLAKLSPVSIGLGPQHEVRLDAEGDAGLTSIVEARGSQTLVFSTAQKTGDRNSGEVASFLSSTRFDAQYYFSTSADRGGNVYVSDSINRTIHAVEPGLPTIAFGTLSGRQSLGRLPQPLASVGAIAADVDRIYISQGDVILVMDL